MRVNIGVMMHQGKHSLGHLLIEGNTVCSKAMLILLLCHPQVHPLCSNAPAKQFYALASSSSHCRWLLTPNRLHTKNCDRTVFRVAWNRRQRKTESNSGVHGLNPCAPQREPLAL